jgi:molybdate transport system substrate-binding protein
VGTALHRKSNSKGLRAAASLKKTFTDIGEQFKTENLGASVEFLMAGSSDLITQLTQGADADVFASADTKTLTRQRRPVCWPATR